MYLENYQVKLILDQSSSQVSLIKVSPANEVGIAAFMLPFVRQRGLPNDNIRCERPHIFFISRLPFTAQELYALVRDLYLMRRVFFFFLSFFFVILFTRLRREDAIFHPSIAEMRRRCEHVTEGWYRNTKHISYQTKYKTHPLERDRMFFYETKRYGINFGIAFHSDSQFIR